MANSLLHLTNRLRNTADVSYTALGTVAWVTDGLDLSGLSLPTGVQAVTLRISGDATSAHGYYYIRYSSSYTHNSIRLRIPYSGPYYQLVETIALPSNYKLDYESVNIGNLDITVVGTWK